MNGPLSGTRMIELGQLIAGPFAGTILGYFGAEVIKVEPPGGDPVRSFRIVDNGTSLWWRSLSRNKKSVVIDLRRTDGQELVRRMCADADVLIENFRPGTLEKWNLDPTSLQQANPKLVIARVSGYGQTGPYSHRPGFASTCEAIGGLRHLTGVPGQIPVRSNLSLGDSLAGLHAALGVVMALLDRQRSGTGQVVDAAIYESVFNMLEAVIPEFADHGHIRQASGTTITGVVPTGTYRCSDGKLVVLGANSDPIFKRLCDALQRPELADDGRFTGNAERVENAEALDDILTSWVGARTRAEALVALEANNVPCAAIYAADDMVADPHFQARNLFETARNGDDCYTLPALSPKLSRSGGGTRWAGPDVGAHTDEVLADLGLGSDEIRSLRDAGIVA